MLNKAFIELFGDVNSFSPGTGMIMADRQISVHWSVTKFQSMKSATRKLSHV